MNIFSIKKNSLNTQGITLIASIMLIVFTSIAVLGVTRFIVQRFLLLDAKRINSNCVYLAQSGVHQAVYDFRFHDVTANGYFTLGQINIDASNYFVLTATAANLLMVNTSTASLNPPGQLLQNLSIQNAADSSAITIDRMIVTWNNTAKLTQIVINGVTAWNGNLSSPANADILGSANFPLNTTPTIYPITSVTFSKKMTGATINIQFVMTDGSTTQTFQVFPAVARNTFTVKSKGQMTGSGIYRTIQAEYNALTGRIINYKEL